jgi:hypothetical protein
MAFVKVNVVQSLTCCTVFGFCKVDKFVGGHRLVDIIRIVNPICMIIRYRTNKGNIHT